MKPVNIGLIGLGTVGCGVFNVLQRNHDEIVRRAGRDILLKKACVRDLSKKRGCDLPLTTDCNEIINDPEIDIVIELMGGTDTAFDIVTAALKQNKNVVTANKALIAERGNEVFSLAHELGLMVGFEAAVAGGIPIIKAIREGLAGNRIESLAGIINGTCNYILTAMQDDDCDFADALKQAQNLGYAEADPTFDIDGFDAAHKLTILASIAFGIPLQFNKVHVEGIRHISRQDIQYATQLGYHIKHLGIAQRQEQGIELRVHPTLVPTTETIAHVNGAMNAVHVQADALGPSLYYGAGAGAEPTASAVVADLVDVVRTLTADPEHRVPHLAFRPDALSDEMVLPIADSQSANYIRINALDKPGVLADVTRILAKHDISIEAFLQKDKPSDSNKVPVVIITHVTKEHALQAALSEIKALPQVDEAIVSIRLERFHA